MCEFGTETLGTIPRGWQCPICKHVYAPFVVECMHCGKNDSKAEVIVDVKPEQKLQEKDNDLTNTGNPGWELTFKTCEKCGGRMLYKLDEMLTSLQPKWIFKCRECGHIQYEPYKLYYPLSENNEKN